MVIKFQQINVEALRLTHYFVDVFIGIVLETFDYFLSSRADRALYILYILYIYHLLRERENSQYFRQQQQKIKRKREKVIQVLYKNKFTFQCK